MYGGASLRFDCLDSSTTTIGTNDEITYTYPTVTTANLATIKTGSTYSGITFTSTSITLYS